MSHGIYYYILVTFSFLKVTQLESMFIFSSFPKICSTSTQLRSDGAGPKPLPTANHSRGLSYTTRPPPLYNEDEEARILDNGGSS